MSESSRVLRRLAAALATALPSLLALWSWLAWGGELPESVGTHWSSSGPADRTTPTGEFFAATLTVSSVTGGIGTVVAVIPRIHANGRRLALLALGSVSAIAAAQWLVSAGLTLHAGDPHSAVLGTWILVVFGSFAYGVIPLLLAPPATNGQHSPDTHISPQPSRPRRECS